MSKDSFSSSSCLGLSPEYPLRVSTRTIEGHLFESLQLKHMNKLTAANCLVFLGFASACLSGEERIDATDPTKIYTFMGGGLKYNEYTNGEHMLEARVIGNIGLGDRAMRKARKIRQGLGASMNLLEPIWQIPKGYALANI